MQKPFNPRNISERLVGSLEYFLSHNDFAELYKSYNWKNDNHKTGLKDIMSLELQISRNARTEGITHEDIIKVAEWGNHDRSGARSLATPALPRRALYTRNGNTNRSLIENPASPIETLDRNTKGLGPTLLSKVLRFAMPEQYGAIDTWCVRVFGIGDGASDTKGKRWVLLYNTGQQIQRTKSTWPSEYGTWINILRYFANTLNSPHLPDCPHPPAFVEKGLREKGKWTCADVEMALFTYAKYPEYRENSSHELISFEDLTSDEDRRVIPSSEL